MMYSFVFNSRIPKRVVSIVDVTSLEGKNIDRTYCEFLHGEKTFEIFEKGPENGFLFTFPEPESERYTETIPSHTTGIPCFRGLHKSICTTLE